MTPYRLTLAAATLLLLTASLSAFAPSASAATPAKLLPVTPQARTQLVASYARAHHKPVSTVKLAGNVKLASFAGTTYALATVVGALRQPEQFSRLLKTTRFLDLGASAGRPCALPAPIVKLFGFAAVCARQGPFPPITPRAGWKPFDHWCTVGNPCSISSPDVALRVGCQGKVNCDPPRCRASDLQVVYFLSLSAKGREMLLTVPFTAWNSVGSIFIQHANAGLVQASHNRTAYCGFAHVRPRNSFTLGLTFSFSPKLPKELARIEKIINLGAKVRDVVEAYDPSLAAKLNTSVEADLSVPDGTQPGVITGDFAYDVLTRSFSLSFGFAGD